MHNTLTTDTGPSLLRIDAVLARVALRKTALYRLMKAGAFPRPISIRHTKVKAWDRASVDAWVADQLSQH